VFQPDVSFKLFMIAFKIYITRCFQEIITNCALAQLILWKIRSKWGTYTSNELFHHSILTPHFQTND